MHGHGKMGEQAQLKQCNSEEIEYIRRDMYLCSALQQAESETDDVVGVEMLAVAPEAGPSVNFRGPQPVCLPQHP